MRFYNFLTVAAVVTYRLPHMTSHEDDFTMNFEQVFTGDHMYAEHIQDNKVCVNCA